MVKRIENEVKAAELEQRKTGACQISFPLFLQPHDQF